jgi:hypothetical protein
VRIEFEQEKERLTNILAEQYAKDLIAMDEYERLLDFVNKTETAKEIEYIRKIIDTNETYALKPQTQLAVMPSTAVEPVQKQNNVSTYYTTKPAKKKHVRKIKLYTGNYELRLYDVDFANGVLTLKLKVYSGDATIYLPATVVVENDMRNYSGKIIMNEHPDINSSEIKNKLILTGKLYSGNIYIIYEK